MLIKNYRSIADTKQKKDLLKTVDYAISRSTPNFVLKNILQKKRDDIFINNKKVADLNINRIFVIGAGEAVGKMAETVEKIIGAENITVGSINYKGQKPKLEKIKIVLAGHPLPNQASIKGTEKILNLKNKFDIKENDIIFCLLSGGGSSLMEYPSNGITIKNIQDTTTELLYCGANINEINSIRQELSRVKGGGLAKHFFPAKIYSLIISDVIGNDLKTIASGPTVNIKRAKSAYSIIKQYKLENKIPKSVLKKIQKSRIALKKIPKAENIIISDINNMIDAAKEKLENLGYKTIILNRKVTGEAQQQAKIYAKKIINLYKKEKSSKSQNYAFVFGGETTVTMENKKGKGGRNQEFTLAFLKEMNDFNKKWSFMSFASDGNDFINGIAGGIVDWKTQKFIKNKKIDINKYLENHKSYNLLRKINSLILTKNGTETDVCDIQVCIIQK